MTPTRPSLVRLIEASRDPVVGDVHECSLGSSHAGTASSELGTSETEVLVLHCLAQRFHAATPGNLDCLFTPGSNFGLIAGSGEFPRVGTTPTPSRLWKLPA